MLDLQDKLNSKVNLDWKQANYNWYRACWIECAELMEKVSWKWWRKQETNKYQAHLELVDIFFFSISALILKNYTKTDLNNIVEIFNETSFNTNKSSLEYIEDLTFSYLSNETFETVTYHFWNVCLSLDLSFDKLYEMYIGKNVLNIFRQDKGYKEGTYIKQWPALLDHGTVEDNVYLEMFMDELKTVQILQESPELLYDYLYNKLEESYPG